MDHGEFVADLKQRVKKAGITQDRIAKAANVDRTTVVHILAGRGKSQNVVETILRLLHDAERRKRPSARQATEVAS